MIGSLINPPGHWRRVSGIAHPFTPGAQAAHGWQHALMSLTVFRSRSTVESGDKWIHVSVSRPDRLPTWAELSKVKDEFIGPNREAYQVLAAAEDHVNLHSYCLHLWAPVDGHRLVANLQDLVDEVGE
jgi:hypothetical protein